MGEKLGQALRAARRAKKLTLAQIAEQIGVSGPAVQQWEAGRTDPSPANLQAAARILELSESEISTASFEAIGFKIQTLHDGEDVSVRKEVQSAAGGAIHYSQLPTEIPVIGIAVGGSGGDFSFNGTATDYIKRPVGLSYARDVYAIYVMNDSMFPKFEDGELLLVSPHTPPANGDYVVIEIISKEPGQVNAGYLKRLVRKTNAVIVVEQYNPPQTLEFLKSDVRALHRVVPWREAAGV